MYEQEMNERFGARWHGAGGSGLKRLYQAGRGNSNFKGLEEKDSVDVTFQEVRAVQGVLGLWNRHRATMRSEVG